MQNKGLHILKGKLNNSLMGKIFCSLMLLSFLMILLMGIWMNGRNAAHHRLEIAQSNLARLEQAKNAMELTTEVLGQNMTQILWSNDFISYMVVPDQGNQDRDYRMVRQLVSAVESSALVKKAFFYNPLSDMIYDNSRFVREAELYSDWCVIQAHYADDDSEETQGTKRTKTSIHQMDHRLFVVQDLEIPNQLGTLVYELNLEALEQALGLKNSEGEPVIYVYDENKNEVFGGLYSYENSLSDWDKEFFLEETNIEKSSNVTAGYYRTDSSLNKWVYLMPMDTELLSLHVKDILPVYIPMSLVFLVLSIAVSYYISKEVYRPINRLMNLVASSGKRRDKNLDAEIDYLEGAYTDALDSQGHLNHMLSSIGPEILDSMLNNLMVGKQLSEQRVTEILYGLGNPILVTGRFQVVVCELTEPENRTFSDAELNLCLLSIRNTVKQLENEKYSIYDIHSDKLRSAILFCFPENYPVVSLKKDVNQCLVVLQEAFEDLSYGFYIEKSGVYQNLLDIRYAYREVVEKLKYHQYLLSESEGRGEEKEEPHEPIGNIRYYQERLKQVVELAVNGDGEGALTLIRDILADIERESTSVENYIQNVQSFLDDLTEKVIKLPLSKEDQDTLDLYHNVSADWKKQTEISLMQPYLVEYSGVLLRMLRSYGGKNRYRYVETAKEYIEGHYSDSNLSLNEIGERIGISASYLSELFYDISGEKFSSYLAVFRVTKAKQLLKSTNVTIKEIGFLCGFNSIQNFIRVFKKITGYTPGQYRENNG